MRNTLHIPTDWEARWNGMSKTMADWLAVHRSADATTHTTDPDDYIQQTNAAQTTLVSLMQSLQAFGKSQLYFFKDGLSSGAAYRLEPAADYPWD